MATHRAHGALASSANRQAPWVALQGPWAVPEGVSREAHPGPTPPPPDQCKLERQHRTAKANIARLSTRARGPRLHHTSLPTPIAYSPVPMLVTGKLKQTLGHRRLVARLCEEAGHVTGQALANNNLGASVGLWAPWTVPFAITKPA
jgi:hypothetical protein